MYLDFVAISRLGTHYTDLIAYLIKLELKLT